MGIMQPDSPADAPRSVLARRPWRREELIAAFRLYCELSFGRLHHRNPEIMALAKVLDRTPSSVAMKLVNLASLDPAITASGRKGLGNASEGDRRIWQEFHADWTALEDKSGVVFRHLGIPEPEVAGVTELLSPTGATSVEALLRIRRGQAFFLPARCPGQLRQPVLHVRALGAGPSPGQPHRALGQ